MTPTIQIEPSTRNELLIDSNFRNFQDFRNSNQSHRFVTQQRVTINESWAHTGTNTNETSTHDLSNSVINSCNTHSRIEPKRDRGYMEIKKDSVVDLYFRDRRFIGALQ